MSRSMLVLAVLGLAATGCGKNSTNPAGEASRTSEVGNFGGAGPNGNDCDGLPVAPESDRVDLYQPVFTNPLNITNPLFPISILDRAVFLGTADGESFRSETTLLAGSKTIVINGEDVETLVSQYVAFIDGRIEEVAYDWYAQDDLGAVWYLGEDVFNYDDGVVVDLNGTWLAGREGPAAMIMPANPQVGDVWRPENACGIVFEEVIATAINVTVDGPSGQVPGALMVSELHMDATYEPKTFAPGYGEFSTGFGANLEALVVAISTDALPGDAPEALDDLSDGADDIFTLAQSRRWSQVADEFEAMEEAWEDLKLGGVPPGLEASMDDALEALDDAIQSRNRSETRHASLDVALSVTDLELRYDDRSEIDGDLIDIWTRRVIVDAQARDRAGVVGDLATIGIIRKRFAPANSGRIDSDLALMQQAVHSTDPDEIVNHAERLRGTLALASQ
ncbi:MAG: hypothetical protein SGI90_09265 [Candidatus Eisenbacteria bacterium]|nr:hypothetical protein [Candidatus Eisenbacteria bacterium]